MIPYILPNVNLSCLVSDILRDNNVDNLTCMDIIYRRRDKISLLPLFFRVFTGLSYYCSICIICDKVVTTLGSSAAMLTMVKSVKILTKSVAVPFLDNQNRLQAGQGTWK